MAIKRRTQSAANAAARSLINELAVIVNQLSDRVNQIIAQGFRNCVMPEPISPFGRAGISVDANAQDIETDNAIVIRHNGTLYNCPAVSAFDISASGAAAGATIAVSTSGIGWVFMNTAGTPDVEVDKNAQDYASVIAAWAAWATATNTLPPGADNVCIGAVEVTEGGSGTWTWGTDSITGETEFYYDFYGTPAIITAAASFAATANAATFAYGAVTLRLGTGTIVSATGKTGVTIAGTAVATGFVGAWLLYVLADDTEVAHQLGAAYADIDAARIAVQNHNANPMMPVVGVIYVDNNSGSTFTVGTTAFNAQGVTSTFQIVGPLSNNLAYGLDATGQAPYSAVDKIRYKNGDYPA